MTEDKYLKEFRSTLSESDNYRERFRRRYRMARREIKRKTPTDLAYSHAQEVLENKAHYTQEHVIGLANELMNLKISGKTHDPRATVLGVKLYELAGAGDRDSVKRRLLRAFKEDPRSYSSEDVSEMEEFLKRHSSKKKGLESEVITIVVSSLSILIALFLLSSNITGNIIGSLSQPTSNLIGGILFILGIIGAFSYFNSKK
jgi:hypothetical protein